MFIEDLHWCDVSTLELLGHLTAQSPTARVLLLATARPEFAPPWPTREKLTTLSLARLTNWRGSGSPRASAPPPAPSSPRSTPGSPQASPRAI